MDSEEELEALVRKEIERALEEDLRADLERMLRAPDRADKKLLFTGVETDGIRHGR